jgi:ubiquinone/menaquinone biosynthesis C-methylase UbiE
MSSGPGTDPKAAYHLRELEIALDPTDPGHLLPPPAGPAMRVLDVGCGAGQTLKAAYPENQAFGVDLDWEALRLGRTLSWSHTLACARAEAMPFPAASFDLVVARVSLPFTDLAQSLPEIRRVLRKGGRAWMVLHSFSVAWNAAKTPRPKAWAYFSYVTMNSLLFTAVGRQFTCFGRQETFQTRRGICRALERAGFDGISFESAARTWTPGRGAVPAAAGKQFQLLVVAASAA